MRLIAALVIFVCAFFGLLGLPSNVAAKTGIYISPTYGEEGTMVQIEGIGFRPLQEVSIRLVRAGALSTSPRDEPGLTLNDEAALPATMHLTTATPDQHFSFVVRTILPTFGEIRDALDAEDGQLEVIAVKPTDSGRLFIARAKFTMTGAVLPSAGIGPDASSSSPSWPIWAALGTAAFAFFAIGWGLIRMLVRSSAGA